MKSLRKMTAAITCETEKGQAFFYDSSSLYERKSIMVMPGVLRIMQDREITNMKWPILILTGELDSDLNKKMAFEWHSKLNNRTLCKTQYYPSNITSGVFCQVS